MTLTEMLNAIGRPKIADMFNVGLLPDGKADTIQELFDTFIKNAFLMKKLFEHGMNCLRAIQRIYRKLVAV